MKNKSIIQKLDLYYKYFFVILTSVSIYLLILLFKGFFYELFNLSLNNLDIVETNIINITYQVFAIVMSFNFFVKNINKEISTFKEYMKDLGIALSTILVYSLTSFLELIILYYAKVNISSMSITAKTIYLISCEILTLSVICLINSKKLDKDIKDFRINFQNYIDKYLKYYMAAVMVMFISNLFINLIYPSVAGNQENVISILNKAPVYMVFSATIFAPIAEELMFRLSIKRIIKDNLTFIITSGLIFGGMHVVGNINNFYDLLYIIPYSAPGIAFAYILSKSDNIIVPMSFHFIHNSIMMLAQIIWLFVL